MEVEEIKAQDLRAAPPVLPWRDFANWIGMGEDHETVRGWIRKGYLPAYKIGKHVMVNVALFTHQLMVFFFLLCRPSISSCMDSSAASQAGS